MYTLTHTIALRAKANDVSNDCNGRHIQFKMVALYQLKIVSANMYVQKNNQQIPKQRAFLYDDMNLNQNNTFKPTPTF